MVDEPNPFGTKNQNISGIRTIWTDVKEAVEGGSDNAAKAQERVLQRYRSPIYRYLRACLGSENAADEVLSDFDTKFLRGDFRNASPERGRFRDLLKTVLRNLVMDYFKRKKRDMPNLSSTGGDLADDPESLLASDRQFLDNWRANLLEKSWAALEQFERETERPLYTVLKLRAMNAEMRSAQIAEELGRQMNRAISADWVRKNLERARKQFADLLLQEVASSIDEPTPDSVEEELLDLGLFEYCKDALVAWREDAANPSTGRA